MSSPISQECTGVPAAYYEQGPTFLRQRLESVLSVQLDPRSIDTYASDALGKTIELVIEATRAYDELPTIRQENSYATEEAAFAFFGLGDIEVILDHIADKDDELHRIDDVIDRIPRIHDVILPPEPINLEHTEKSDNDAWFKETVPRLKTTLFVLTNAYDIDITDRASLRMVSGAITPDMWRKHSYTSVDIPKLERLVLVCDEKGNRTYVFDTNKLARLNVSKKDLIAMNKTGLDRLIVQNPAVGTNFTYSQNFAGDLIGALEEPNYADQISALTPNFLQPHINMAPEGVLSLHGLTKLLGISNPALKRLLTSLTPEQQDALGKTDTFQFGPRRVIGYTPAQQNVIRKAADERGLLILPEAPDDILPLSGIARVVGISPTTIKGVLSDLTPEQQKTLGKLNSYQFSGRGVTGYSPDQQKVITTILGEKGFLVQIAPDDVLSVKGIANSLGISVSTIIKIINNLTPDQQKRIGQVDTYKFGPTRGKGYTPSQQAIIKNMADDAGYFAPHASDQLKSMRGLTGELGIQSNAIKSIISSLTPEQQEVFGATFTRRFYASTVTAYTLHQQAMIKAMADEQGLLAAPAPEGVLALSKLAASLGTTHGTLKRILGKLTPEQRKKLGKTQTYKFQTVIATGYNQDQQEIIREIAHTHLLVAPKAQKG